MTLDQIKGLVPDYAKDLRLNLESVLTEGGAPGLSAKQIRMIALGSAIASRYRPLVSALEAWAGGDLEEAEGTATRAAAAVMAMNNVYYRFVHLVGDPEYARMRAGLRMNAMANPGIAKTDFELISLAVSAVNGCGMCLESHEKVLRKHDVSQQAVQSAARIAAVVHAVAVTLEQAGLKEAGLAAAA